MYERDNADNAESPPPAVVALDYHHKPSLVTVTYTDILLPAPNNLLTSPAMASAEAGPSSSHHVMSVLQTLYVDPDPGAKRRAGEWLEEFQHSVRGRLPLWTREAHEDLGGSVADVS